MQTEEYFKCSDLSASQKALQQENMKQRYGQQAGSKENFHNFQWKDQILPEYKP